MGTELTLYCDAQWMCPWSFHAMVALEEKQLSYTLVPIPVPIPADVKATLLPKALLACVPVLVHDDAWITESLAISEYLAERFPTPGNPRIFPADLGERARSRQIMMWLRTSLSTLRSERPSSNVFGRSAIKPFTDKGQADADELVRVATTLVKPGATQLFSNWSIADADLALALKRMISSSDPMPEHLVTYAAAQWARDSAKRYLAHAATAD